MSALRTLTPRLSTGMALLALVAMTALASGCAPMPPRSGLATGAERLVPITSVTEQQDEWLHGHCAAKKIVTVASRPDGDRLLRATGANFGELVYDDGAFNTLPFACPVRPEWSSADAWVPLAATATAEATPETPAIATKPTTR